MCLDTVCTGYKENNDGTSDNTAKISSAIEASGVWQSLSVALKIRATETAKQLQKASASSTKRGALALHEPLILLGCSLLCCWVTLHPHKTPLSCKAYAPTTIPAAVLASRLLKACSPGGLHAPLQRSSTASSSVKQLEAGRLLHCCTNTAKFLCQRMIMQALHADIQHLHEDTLAVTANQHVQVLLVLHLGVAATLLHEQYNGMSPVTVKSGQATSSSTGSSRQESIQVQPFSRELLLSIGIRCLRESLRQALTDCVRREQEAHYTLLQQHQHQL